MDYRTLIPPAIKSALDGHAKHGRDTGGLTAAVLHNDLANAIARADSESMAALRYIVQYACDELPSACWGSREKAAAWRAKFAAGGKHGPLADLGS